MSAADHLIEFLRPKMCKEIHVGPWLTVDQNRIDRFADVTGDIQWIHTNPERAKKESPYGNTVAHGLLTLSLLPFLTESNHPDFFQNENHLLPAILWHLNFPDRLNFLLFLYQHQC